MVGEDREYRPAHVSYLPNLPREREDPQTTITAPDYRRGAMGVHPWNPLAAQVEFHLAETSEPKSPSVQVQMWDRFEKEPDKAKFEVRET